MYYTDKNGQQMYISNDELARRDAEQGREHIPASAVSAMVGLTGGLCLIEMNAPTVQKTAQRAGCWYKLRAAQSLLCNALDNMLDVTSLRQNLSIRENTKEVIVQVGAKPQPMCVNLTAEDADTLAAYAREHCRTSCLATAAEATKCPLRAVLDCVPGLGKDETGICICQYME